ncbi:low affinity iron permease family protein [Nocardia sp. CA-119907]|uniref:low affinity iron permease family protein n=1 Tax=Nocardia sp. CA-119907 TaxID=3239973 RepID=UPI003D966B77
MQTKAAHSESGTKTMPSEVRGPLTIFDRFATATATLTSKAGFFVFCVLLVLLWAPTFLVLPSIDTWQLVINTATTIVTFLLVALLQNTQSRSDEAIQQKLNAIADALADCMGELSTEYPELDRHRQELADAVGLETRESS